VNRRLRRAPLLALAFASLIWGVWMGLLRLGWALPLPWPDQLILHGPLMIGGFLGTLIGLERAIGLARPWAYAAPMLTAAGAVLLVFGPAGPAGPGLITVGSLVLVAVFFVVLRRERSMFAVTMAGGAVAWAIGNLRWLSGAAIYRAALWWIAFLVLTIAGERLELNRMRRPPRRVRVAFAIAALVMVSGVALATAWPDAGVRAAGAGLLALALWLARYDIARRTIAQHGVTKFIAVCLLSGYAWLGVGGAIALVTGIDAPGPMHDALLHAVFLGFVVSMIFGHAPIVFPAILGWPMRFRASFYVHLAVLHASVALRLTGDLVEDLGQFRAWGGALNALALAMFVVNSVSAVASGARAANQRSAEAPAER
jgi:hypothetical protein